MSLCMFDYKDVYYLTKRITASLGRAELVAIPVCGHSVSTHFSSIYCSYIRFLLAVFKGDAENGFPSLKHYVLASFEVIAAVWVFEAMWLKIPFFRDMTLYQLVIGNPSLRGTVAPLSSRVEVSNKNQVNSAA